MQFTLIIFFFFSVTSNSLAQSPRLVLPVGHTASVKAISFSPKGHYFVTGSSDFTARVWDIITGKEVQTLKGHTASVNSVVISADEKKIISSSEDNTIRVWDIFKGKEDYILYDSAGVQHISCSPNGKSILSVSDFDIARVLDLATGKIRFTLKVEEDEIRTAAFSPDGKYIVTYSTDEEGPGMATTVWNAINGQLLFSWKDNMRPCFSNDGRLIITISDKGTATIRNIKTGELVGKLYSEYFYQLSHFSKDNKFFTGLLANKIVTWNCSTGNIVKQTPYTTKAIATFKFSPDRKKILGVDNSDHNLEYIDAETGKQLYLFKGHEATITYYDYSPDSKYLVSAGADNKIIVWDLTNGTVLHEIKSHTDEIMYTEISPTGKYTATLLYDRLPRIWETQSGKATSVLTGHHKYIPTIQFSPDEKFIVTSSIDETARVWDPKTGRQLSVLEHPAEVRKAIFSPDSKQIITSSDDQNIRKWDLNTNDSSSILKIERDHYYSYIDIATGGKYVVTKTSIDDFSVRLWESKTGKQLYLFDDDSIESTLPKFSPDGKYLALVGNLRPIFLWDVATDIKIFFKEKILGYTSFLNFSRNGKYLFSADYFYSGYIWDVAEGKKLYELRGHTGQINTASFSSDGNLLVTSSKDGTAIVWDLSSGKIVSTLKDHTQNVLSASFDPSGKYVMTSSEDRTTKWWNAATGQLIYTRMQLEGGEFIVQIPSGYYFCSGNAAKMLHYVTKDLKILSFEQLDVKYNRPDKVLNAIGNTDTALIKSYRKAWEKRIKKLGIDTTAFRDGYSVPESDFVNRDIIEYEQKTGTLTLHIKSIDSTYKLDRFNVWVNEAPIFGQRGINIRKRNKNNLDTTITIKLSQGENRIETSITNVNGTESYRMPLIVNYTTKVRQKEMIRFVGIGIDKFVDNKYNLQYSAKDIRDLSKKLKEKYKDDIIIDTLFNENVTTSKVKALKQKLQQTTVNDKVIVAYSGHGMLSKNYDYYLSTYSVNFDNPEQNGLPYDELENLLDSIPARKKLMLIDACHSGEVDKDDLVTLNASSDSLIKGLKPVAYKKEGHLGLKNSFELMQSLFVNVGKSTGATIISAAAGTQFALERNDLKNGVFTYSILEAMNKYPTLKISELKKIVGERVEELTNGLQKPTSRNETIAVDWSIW